ncbi:MAG: HEPN domain-containing protein [Rickettsia endosymbiont of Sceptobius lativentris]|nr:HEPN domain-containing protein [Rickettsia endosymbiont of Sceptobius lativentris]
MLKTYIEYLLSLVNTCIPTFFNPELGLRDNLNKCAFELHQATESLYSTILLVFSNYKPKSHDIEELGSMAGNYDNELWTVFPQLNEEQKKCFELLQKAYVDARYDKNYKITKEQLLYLIERVEKLKEITERICLKQIG